MTMFFSINSSYIKPLGTDGGLFLYKSLFPSSDVLLTLTKNVLFLAIIVNTDAILVGYISVGVCGCVCSHLLLLKSCTNTTLVGKAALHWRVCSCCSFLLYSQFEVTKGPSTEPPSVSPSLMLLSHSLIPLKLPSSTPPPLPDVLASPGYPTPLLTSYRVCPPPIVPGWAMAVPAAHEFHWQSLARLPNGRVYHTLSELGGQMYMLGGCDAAGRPCSAMDLYSPEVLSHGRWSPCLRFSTKI